MPTSQENSRGRHAAHFSSASADASAKASAGAGEAKRARRTATKRNGAARKPARTNAGGAAGETQKPRTKRQAHGVRSANRVSERTARATERAAAARERRTKASRKKAPRSNARQTPLMAVLALVVVAAVVGLGFLVIPRLFQRNDPSEQQESYPAGEQVVVTIPEGAGGSQIAQLLIDAHVISDETSFYQEIQKQNADARMKSGSYLFVTGATPSEVVRQLVEGPNATEYQLKLAEGLTVTQTAAAVESQVGIAADEFMEQAKASNYVDDYPFLDGVSDDSLEGYLFAKTYDFGGKSMTADSAIRMMLSQYEAEVASLDMESARAAIKDRYNIEISDYGILKVASIIEREAVTEEHRPLVSSVIYNRLSMGMALQSDATMMYVTGGEVTAADLQTDSPYNTYLYQGLTPTPICSPSIESIKAAMEPADTDYLYFFINENVEQFSVTYEEHQQAIRDSMNS